MFAAFAAAALVPALVSGPGVVYFVGCTLAQGRAAGVASVLGVACGNFGNAVGAALGLMVPFGVVALAGAVLKLAGAALVGSGSGLGIARAQSGRAALCAA